MTRPTKVQELATILKSLLLAGVFIFCGVKVVLIGGTKANGTFAPVTPLPSATKTASTTTTTTRPPATKTVSTTTTTGPAPEAHE